MMQILKEYRGAALLFLNTLLLLLLVFGQNALSLFKTGYAGADSLVDASEEDLAVLEIHDPEFGGYIVRLVRGDRLSIKKEKKNKADKNKEKSSFPGASDETRKQLAYEWDLELYAKAGMENATGDTGKPVAHYKVDPERLLGLLKGLQNARDYYGIPSNPKRDASLGMGTDERGHFEGITLHLFSKEGARPTVLYISKKNVHSSQTYVRLKKSDTIYLVEENLPSLVGVAERLYFRDRGILPKEIRLENITMLDALWSRPRLRVRLSKQKEAWILVLPEQSEADKGEVESLLRDILSWKASSYHSELPKDADQSAGLELSLYYNPAGNITDQLRKALELYPKKESSSVYYIKAKDDSDWREISSIYLEDLKKPLERYRKRPL